MPGLNFPTNRDELNPPQPSGPLQDGDEYTAAGITWTWNATLGVWSADPGNGFDEAVADGRYLSKLTNDRAAGAITFEKVTNHEGGVSTGTVSNGSTSITLAENTPSNFSFSSGTVTQGGTQAQGGLFTFSSTGSYTRPVYGFHSYLGTQGFSSTERIGAYYTALSAATNISSDKFVAGYISQVQSDTNQGTGDNYNFYAAGDAPSYFAGQIKAGPDGSTPNVTLYPDGRGDFAALVSTGGVDIEKDNLEVKTNLSGDTGGYTAVLVTPQFTGSNNTSCRGVDVALGRSTEFTSKPTFQFGLGINGSYGNAGATNNYAFYTSLASNTVGNNNFGFYAAGNAPNYFAGDIYVSGNAAFNASDLNNNDSTISGTQINPTNGQINVKAATNDSSQNNRASLNVYRKTNVVGTTTGNFTTVLQKWFFIDHLGARIEHNLRGDGSGGFTLANASDYRTKENIVDLPSATDAIKALRPVNYNYIWAPGQTRPGFVAHELQEILPVAVIGEKDSTEAIGTLTDWDGTELETEVIEPSAEELTYTEMVPDERQTTSIDGEPVMVEVTRTKTWTATGERDVYQGVDQTKLIPLLTKALQEALERIEVLEAAVGPEAAAYGVTNEPRRARNDDGTYRGDDPETPDVNEAWEGGEPPAKGKRGRTSSAKRQ